MRDQELRELERRVAEGDTSATAALRFAEARTGRDVERFERALRALVGPGDLGLVARALEPLPDQGWALRPCKGLVLALVVADAVAGDRFVAVGACPADEGSPLHGELVEIVTGDQGSLTVRVREHGPEAAALVAWARVVAPDRVREWRDVVERWILAQLENPA